MPLMVHLWCLAGPITQRYLLLPSTEPRVLLKLYAGTRVCMCTYYVYTCIVRYMCMSGQYTAVAGVLPLFISYHYKHVSIGSLTA